MLVSAVMSSEGSIFLCLWKQIAKEIGPQIIAYLMCFKRLTRRYMASIYPELRDLPGLHSASNIILLTMTQVDLQMELQCLE
jgi:hypothetical protein